VYFQSRGKVVGFTNESRHQSGKSVCPLSANNGIMQRSITERKTPTFLPGLCCLIFVAEDQASSATAFRFSRQPTGPSGSALPELAARVSVGLR
jgi:hypothetical protein